MSSSKANSLPFSTHLRSKALLTVSSSKSPSIWVETTCVPSLSTPLRVLSVVSPSSIPETPFRFPSVPRLSEESSTSLVSPSMSVVQLETRRFYPSIEKPPPSRSRVLVKNCSPLVSNLKSTFNKTLTVVFFLVA